MKDCIELILNNSKSNPGNLCVIEGDAKITYGEFIDLVKRIATYLRKNGYNKVLINMEQGINSYAVIIAVVMAGGHYCPLSVDSPVERKIYIINEFKPDIIVTQNNLALPPEKLQSFKQLLISELITSNLNAYTLEELYNKTPGENAYIIYTSGSTGNPKGVIIRRESLNKFLEWSINEYKCSTEDK